MRLSWGRLGPGLWVAVVVGAGCLDEGFVVVNLTVEEDLRAVAPVNGAILAVGQRGRVVGFDPSGLFVDLSTTAEVRGRAGNLWALAEGPLGPVVAGSGGLTLQGDFPTSTAWTRVPTGVVESLDVLLRFGAGSVWALGSEGTFIERREDGPWRPSDAQLELAPGERFSGGWALAPAALLVTDRGRVFERDVAGGWQQQTVGEGTKPLFCAWSATVSADRWVVGAVGTAYVRREASSEWTLVPAGVSEDLYAITGDPTGDHVLAVGARGIIVEGGPAGLEPVSSGVGQNLFGVARTSERVYVVGANGTWLERDN